MHSDWDTYISAYQSASPELRRLLDSETVPDQAAALLAKYKLPASYTKTLIAQLADLVLSLMKADDLVEIIQKECGLPDSTKEQLSNDLKQFVGTPERKFASSDGETAPEVPQFTEQSSVPPTLPEERLPTETIQPLRTMQSDANRIHGYGAYRRQAEQPIPNANGTQPLVSPPRYVDIDENEK